MADELREDALVYPTLVTLASCLENELRDAGAPVSWCGPLVGVDPTVLDVNDTDCGAAYVLLQSSFPSTQGFPSPDGVAGTCASLLAFNIEVGVLRCGSPFGDQRGASVELEAALEMTRQMTADMAAARRAIACCFGQHPDTEYMLGLWAPLEWQGGMYGGSWQLTTRQAF